MAPIGRLAFIVNAQKNGAPELRDDLIREAERAGLRVSSTEAYPVPEKFLESQDACCVIGGDGTLLSAVPEAMTHQVPVFGVNHGKLGFLATYSEEDIRRSFAQILQGQFVLNQRSVLSVRTADAQAAVGLNDAVIKSTDNRRLIGLRVTHRGDLVTEYYCDGLIFCTPTGSTAYNLSAGGPIIHPGANVLAMTPICPHTLTNRTVVFDQERELDIACVDHCLPQVTLDGAQRFHGNEIFPLRIRIAAERLLLLQKPSYSHFATLRSKLRWGGDSASFNLESQVRSSKRE